MYKVMISFVSDSVILEKYGLGYKNQEFFVGTSEDVCKIISNLSHLKPIVTLQEVSVVNADFVLKNFEVKEV